MARIDPRLAELEELYRRRFREFQRVALAIVGDRELADEAVHDAFGDAIRSRRTFRGEGPLEAWVWRAVVNAARRARPKHVEWPFGSAELARRNGSASAEPSALREAIVQLPERQRLVLFLRYYADLDYETIGEAIGIRTGTVSATLHAAHAALRRLLEEVPR